MIMALLTTDLLDESMLIRYTDIPYETFNVGCSPVSFHSLKSVLVLDKRPDVKNFNGKIRTGTIHYTLNY
jgi:hypothetical protein